VAEVPARAVQAQAGVIWPSPSPGGLAAGSTRAGLDLPGSKASSAGNRARTLDESQSSTSREVLTEQLGPILDQLSLGDQVPAAVAWCVQQGADNLDDIVQDKGCAEALAEALGLPRIKRNKLIARLDPVENDVMRIKSL
jgi:hypothetical protein